MSSSAESTSLLNIIHEDNDLLVLNKPAGLVCHPTKNGPTSSLIGRVRLHLGEDCRMHLINRLDRETSGIVLVGKSDRLARDLRKQWEAGKVRKQYLALVHGWPAEDQGSIQAPIGRDVTSRVAVKDHVRPDGAASATNFRVERRFHRTEGRFAVLQVQPKTGRKHQIRIHLQHLGHSIVGDKIYGCDEDHYLALVEGRLSEAARRQLILPFHALHAAAIRFQFEGETRDFQAPAESWFEEFLKGEQKDWWSNFE